MKTFHRIKVNRWPWCVRVPRWFAMRVWLWLPGDWHSQSSGAVGGSLITRSLSGNQEFHATYRINRTGASDGRMLR